MMPGWIPEVAVTYLAHTSAGMPIRALARAKGCHASTVLRQVRRVEAWRDDPLVDEALESLARAHDPRSVRSAVSKEEPSMPTPVEKAAGTTMSVSSVELSNPPMMAIPMLVRCLEASLSPIATGNIPAMRATLVMRIGRSLTRPASMIAFFTSHPSRKRWFV